MINFPVLTKTQATFIKSLSKSNNRKETDNILVEGVKCCLELINSKYKIAYFVINSDEKIAKNELIITKAQKRQIQIFQAKNSIFEALCDAKSPQDIIAIAKSNPNIITDNQSYIALDNVSDPGNVGTIIRTAEWFGIKQIILLGNCVDKYSPKVIRSSMGSIFRVNVTNCVDNADILEKHFTKIPLYAASLNGSIEISKLNPAKIFGLIVGNESRGISKQYEKYITKSFFIKGQSNVESLNVAVATGIALFHLCSLSI